jgi:hypothetical protein
MNAAALLAVLMGIVASIPNPKVDEEQQENEERPINSFLARTKLVVWHSYVEMQTGGVRGGGTLAKGGGTLAKGGGTLPKAGWRDAGPLPRQGRWRDPCQGRVAGPLPRRGGGTLAKAGWRDPCQGRVAGPLPRQGGGTLAKGGGTLAKAGWRDPCQGWRDPCQGWRDPCTVCTGIVLGP